MIANASPPVIVRCMSRAGKEKRAFFSRRDAKRARYRGQHTYLCPFGEHFHNTSKKAAA